MKHLLLLALSLLCLTACASLPGETQEVSGSAQVLHYESTSLTLDSVQQDLWDAVEEFLWENPSFRSAYRQGAPCEFLSGRADTVRILWLKKGDAELVLKIGDSQWRLKMGKNFLNDWEVTSFHPMPVSLQISKTTVGS